MMKNFVIGSLALFAASTMTPAIAQERPITLASDVQIVRVVDVDGQKQEKLEAATNVIPGDTLIFTTKYTNAGGEQVSDFTVVNPVPKNMVLPDQDFGNATVSVDGGKTYSQLSSLQVRNADTGEMRAAQPSDVTHLRWTLTSVAPGASGSVKFSAVVR